MDPKQDKELMQIQKQAGNLVQRATSYQVVSDKTYEEAGTVVSWIAQSLKTIEKRRKFFSQPLEDQIRNINGLFREYSTPFKESREITSGKMLSYRQGQERKRRDEETKRLEEATKIAQKEGVPAEEVIAGMEKKESVSATEKTTVRKGWTFKIINENKIPRKFLMPDEVSIRKAVREGVRIIAGINIFEKETIIDKRR